MQCINGFFHNPGVNPRGYEQDWSGETASTLSEAQQSDESRLSTVSNDESIQSTVPSQRKISISELASNTELETLRNITCAIHDFRSAEIVIEKESKNVRGRMKSSVEDPVHYNYQNRAGTKNSLLEMARYCSRLEEEATQLEELASTQGPQKAKALRKEAQKLQKEALKTWKILLKRQKNLRNYSLYNYPGDTAKKRLIDEAQRKIANYEQMLIVHREQIANGLLPEYQLKIQEQKINYLSFCIDICKDECVWLEKQSAKRSERVQKEEGAIKRMLQYQNIGNQLICSSVGKLMEAQKSRQTSREVLLEELDAAFGDDCETESESSTYSASSAHSHLRIAEMILSSGDVAEHATHSMHIVTEVMDVGPTVAFVATAGIPPVVTGLSATLSGAMTLFHSWKFLSTQKKLRKLRKLEKLQNEMEKYFTQNPQMKQELSKMLGEDFSRLLNEELTEEKLEHASGAIGGAMSATGFSLLLGTTLFLGGTAIGPPTAGLGLILAGCGLGVSCLSILHHFETRGQKKEAKQMMELAELTLCSTILKEKILAKKATKFGEVPPPIFFSTEVLKYMKKDVYEILGETLTKIPLVKGHLEDISAAEVQRHV